MSHLDILISDRIGLLGAGGSSPVVELSPTIAVTYLLLRLLVPVLLIAAVSRGATPAQRISLIRTYLLSPQRPVGSLRFWSSPCRPRSDQPTRPGKCLT
jgi:hypothetical protein